ncbi:MAG: arginine--tRNA ligase [Opitutales bacterium]
MPWRMQVWFHPSKAIENAVAEVASSTEGFGPGFDPAVRPAEPTFGDFQVNGVLPHAKRQGANPRELGARLIKALEASEAFDPELLTFELAGPGFINFRLSRSYLFQWIRRYGAPEDFRKGAGMLYDGKKAVVDFSSPNTAKQMHVGHIRSSVIGEAIARMLEFCGAEVVRDNHIGDWGTQFGILILAIKREQYDPDASQNDPLDDFERLYRQGTALTQEDPAEMEAARAELVKLQNGDPENIAYWEMICRASYAAFEAIYERLGIRFDEVLGESFYQDKVDRVCEELKEHGVAEEDQGALVVFHRDHKRFAKQPLIVRKSDGASNYATTDLATVLYRVEKLRAEELVYVTDGRQQDHFQQVFLTVQKWFAASGRPIPEMKHVWFGTILGEDGKAIKTRSGEPVRLKELLDEAEERALALVSEKNPSLPEAERKRIARAVGIGAVRYSDLAQNRTSDYIFDWDRILSFDGNTAPYLLYAVARIHSIFRKAGVQPNAGFPAASEIESEMEERLTRKLLGFVGALDTTLTDLRPHFLCTYLFELAGDFSTFYNAEKVMTEDPAVRDRRLLLCARTLAVLEMGLSLLGLETLERM